MKRAWSFIVMCGIAVAAAAQDIPEAEWVRLAAGEVVLLDARDLGGGGAAHARALVRADAAAVWRVITSCEDAFVFVDGLQRCDILEDTGRRVTVRQVVDKSWLLPRQDFVFESLRDPYREIHVRLLEGNLDALDGHWTFQPVAEGTLVDYTVRVEPAFPVPAFLVRRNISRDMPNLLACVRALAGGSGSSDQSERDRERCPGTQ
jgi:ribosome-associated toxin RatA of RatAB toxin-antitoxin module